MKKTFSLILLICIAIEAFPQRDTLLTERITCQEGAWKLVFEDEFNNGTLNKDEWLTWFPYTDDGGDSCVFCRTHGDEGQVSRQEGGDALLVDGVVHGRGGMTGSASPTRQTSA